MNRIHTICGVLMLAVFAACSAPNARADYAVLCSGETLHISGYLREGSKILLYVPGGTITVSAADVIRFLPEDRFTSSAVSSALGVPFASQIHAAATKNGLDEKLISSVISAESNFNSRAISPAHAMGLMQLMPATATRFSVRNPFDPAQNISAGARYLKQLLKQYDGNLKLALAAYNAGPKRVAEYGGVPPFRETDRYIRRVTSKLKTPNLFFPAAGEH